MHALPDWDDADEGNSGSTLHREGTQRRHRKIGNPRGDDRAREFVRARKNSAQSGVIEPPLFSRRIRSPYSRRVSGEKMRGADSLSSDGGMLWMHALRAALSGGCDSDE